MKPIEVLLVEDQAGDILLIKQILAEESFPVHVRVAMDAPQAMDVLAQRRLEPDLVILDLNLPKISGLSVLERCHTDVPVVVFTSSSNPQDRQRSLELGAKEFVQKPTDLREYSRAVSEFVEHWTSPSDLAS